ncbi:heme-binding domain-containing protein [Mucilaginibacter aquariorum]|uniref:Heme-binding domain-containing protein n=1 Tax=Mucilaginibacter aquariorum TaxID=2967225 RepID=A0ABT1SXS5_9SPHI|nr:heme-binding domain-containing protein [Mucilaginibacter aquariorum]MCQ6957005.1 heme-binding domain-containing protein [Mucilaginibacter aquariorum]
MSSNKKHTFLGIGIIMLILLITLQFLRPDLKTPPVTGEISVPVNVKAIFKRSCYDCHSNQTKLGWGDKIVPIYWQVAKHVNTGRAHLNFSEWDKLTPVEQKTKLWEAVNHATLGAMPRADYALIHPSAKLSTADIATLKNYLAGLVDHKASDTSKINAENAQYKLWINEKQEPVKHPVALNGIPYDPDYKNWLPLSTSDRFENGTMRVIFGNDIAVNAAKNGQTRPWPDGARLAKALWTQLVDTAGNTRTGAFVQVDLMIKNAQKYASTGGWGFARFKTLKLAPYGKTTMFASECINCHRPMKNNDFVFTVPVKH